MGGIDLADAQVCGKALMSGLADRIGSLEDEMVKFLSTDNATERRSRTWQTTTRHETVAKAMFRDRCSSFCHR